MASRAIFFEKVSQRFAGTGLVLDEISFEAARGEFVAFLGPSGCGKSTILRLIAGLESPTQGRVQICSQKLGFVFQDASLMPWRTVMENLLLPLELVSEGAYRQDTDRKFSKLEQRDRARELLKEVGLSRSEDRLPSQLSGGMRMRVSLARALITEPEILLLDEPFAALDELTRSQLGLEVREIASARGTTTVFVTHSMNEAITLSDRAILLSSGPARILEEVDLARKERRTAEDRIHPFFLEKLAYIQRSFKKSYESPS